MIVVRSVIAFVAAVVCGLLFVGAVTGYSLSLERATAHYGALLAMIMLGLIVWRHRPESRSGILLTAAPLAYALSELPVVLPKFPLAVTLGLAAIQLNAAVFAHAFLSYPTGRLNSPLERGFVGVGYLFALVYALPLLLFYDPRAPYEEGVLQCPACALTLTHVGWRDVSGLMDALDGVLLVLVVCFVVLLVRKLLREGAAARRTVLPVVVAGCIAAVQLVVQIALVALDASASFWTSSEIFWLETAAVAGVPATLAIGLLWGRSRDAVVAGRGATAYAVTGFGP